MDTFVFFYLLFLVWMIGGLVLHLCYTPRKHKRLFCVAAFVLGVYLARNAILDAHVETLNVIFDPKPLVTFGRVVDPPTPPPTQLPLNQRNIQIKDGEVVYDRAYWCSDSPQKCDCWTHPYLLIHGDSIPSKWVPCPVDPEKEKLQLENEKLAQMVVAATESWTAMAGFLFRYITCFVSHLIKQFGTALYDHALWMQEFLSDFFANFLKWIDDLVKNLARILERIARFVYDGFEWVIVKIQWVLDNCLEKIYDLVDYVLFKFYVFLDWIQFYWMKTFVAAAFHSFVYVLNQGLASIGLKVDEAFKMVREIGNIYIEMYTTKVDEAIRTWISASTTIQESYLKTFCAIFVYALLKTVPPLLATYAFWYFAGHKLWNSGKRVLAIVKARMGGEAEIEKTTIKTRPKRVTIREEAELD